MQLLQVWLIMLTGEDHMVRWFLLGIMVVFKRIIAIVVHYMFLWDKVFNKVRSLLLSEAQETLLDRTYI